MIRGHLTNRGGKLNKKMKIQHVRFCVKVVLKKKKVVLSRFAARNS